MGKIVFECETITPMFMYGADGKTPELRPASIKGVMRFWWRAINGHLPLEKLKEQEAEIFGSTDKKSKVIIYPIKIIQENDYKIISLTPHHKKDYCSESNENCFYKKEVCLKSKRKIGKMYEFNISMSVKEVKDNNDNIIFDENKLKKLFILMTHLGGFGQRSRRGFGSIKINKIEIISSSADKIESFIKAELNKQFNYKIKKKKNEQYPYIRKIEIGRKYKNFKNLLEIIGKASHDSKCGKALFINNDRLASPVYVSIIKVSENDYRPIITTLNCVSEKYINIKEMLKRQKQFKEAIL